MNHLIHDMIYSPELTCALQIARNQRVRIAYLGRVLKEQVPLVDQGWNPAHVVNALVVSRQSLP